MSDGEASTVERLFQQMLDTAPAERPRVLENATEGNSALYGRIMQLVGAYENSAVSVDTRASLLPPETETHPLRVGRYEILSVLAEGGVSIVYVARQQQPSRPIALKIIRSCFASPGMFRRFAMEAEVVGRLRHPGIAHVYDAGDATAEFCDGHTETRAFLAMELIDGLTLPAFARTRALGVTEIVRIMALVCDAVHAAHQQGVIHRDLKPANILVDSSGQPKVLDFGAACLTADLMSAAAISQVGVLIGTGPYLSPEHAAGDPGQIDTRSDVYSLGVILYELLSGKSPIDVAGVPIQEAARRILSTAAMPLSEASSALAGDLSLVVGMAIAKNKKDRYQSAAEFSADLRQFLARGPVTAHAPSAMYELRMFAARRKRLVVALGIGASLLCALTITAVYAANIARLEAREKAAALAEVTRSRDEAQAAATFLEGVLSAANPEEVGRDVLVRDLLDEAATLVNTKFSQQPASEARAREAIGRTYFGLGDLENALLQLKRAYALRRDTLGENDAITARCAMALGAVTGVMGESNQAAALYTQALAVFRQIYPPGHDAIISALSGLAGIESDRQNFASALELYREAISSARKRNDGLNSSDLRSIAAYAALLQWTGDSTAAQLEYNDVLPRMRKELGTDDPRTLEAESGAAAVALSLGKTTEAESLYRKVLQARTRVLGPDHGDTLGASNNLAMLLSRTGRNAEAEELFTQIIQNAERVLGPDHRNTLKSRFNLGQTVLFAGRLDEALKLFTDTLAAQRKGLGPRHVDIADTLQMLATINSRRGDTAAAAEQFREAIEMSSQLLSPQNQFVLQLRSERGACLTKLARFDEAKAELQLAVNGLRAAGSAQSAAAALAAERLAACQESQDRLENAARTKSPDVK